jgi:hypothetical protein
MTLGRSLPIDKMGLIGAWADGLVVKFLQYKHVGRSSDSHNLHREPGMKQSPETPVLEKQRGVNSWNSVAARSRNW